MASCNEISVLNSIYSGAKTGSLYLGDLIPKVESPALTSDLKTQNKEYDTIADLAAEQLASFGKEPNPMPTMQKLGMKASLEMNTLMDKSTSQLAEMLISGSTMGISKMTKVLNSYENPDPQVKGLADRLIQFEQQNIERFKTYLS